VHPYVGDKFGIVQNGTDHTFHSWGIIEGFDGDMSDSYMLLQFLEKHADTLEECLVVLEKIQPKVSFGVIIVTDKHGNFLYYSDGERSAYWDLKDSYTFNWFRSKKDAYGDETTCKGYLLGNFE